MLYRSFCQQVQHPISGHRRSFEPGFTLLELLLALGVFAILGVLATITLTSVLSSDKAADARSTQLAAMQRAQLFLRRDIEQIVPRPVRDELDALQPAVVGGVAGLEFTRAGWRNPLPDKHLRSELQRVSYAVEDAKLVRRYWHVLDRAQDSLSVESAVLSEVEDFTLRYFDPREKQWLNDWPPVDPDRQQDLPAVIELTVITKAFGEIRRLIGLVGFDE